LKLRALPILALGLLLVTACDAAPGPVTTPIVSPVNSLRSTLVIAAGPASVPAMLLLELAATLKYIEAEGLTVDLRHFADGAQAAQLVSGTAQFAAASLETPIKQQPLGRSMKMILSMVHLPGVAVLVRADLQNRIKSPSDFKGYRIGVSAIGADAHLMLNLLTANAGLKAEYYTVVPAGTTTLGVAFEQKQIDIGIGADPFVTPLVQKRSAFAIVDLRKQFDSDKYLIGEYEAAGIIAESSLLANHPQTAQRVVNAAMRAMAYLKSHSANDLADLLPDAVTGKDKQAWIDAYTASQEIYSTDGRVTQPAVENAVDAYRRFSALNPAAKIDIMGLYDNRFVDSAR
jgi:NitT/TauT family transport system substrate-binding protein